MSSIPPTLEVLARGAYQRRNFAVARAAAEAYLGALDEGAVTAAAASTLVPGRFEVVDTEPDTVLDGAHNPGGMAALAEALRGFLDGRRLVACISILDDKDAAGMLRELLPLCDEVICTASANPRALPPGTLQSLCGQLGGPPARTVRDPRQALEEARVSRRARRRRAGHRHHLPDRRSAAARRGRAPEHAMNDDGPSVPAMIAAVAVIVALVILVFFALGYGFGRLFL